MRQEMESRSVKAQLADVEVRSDEAGRPVGFTGYAAVFNQRTMIGRKPWGFWEEIAPGAFRKAIQESDPVMLLNHNDDMPLARQSSGSLRLSEDERGLKVDADLPDTSYGRDLAENLRNGNINGMSFRFAPVKEEWSTEDDGVESRKLLEVELPEVSPVTFPAYKNTVASLRSVVDLARKNRTDSSESPQTHEPAETTRDDQNQPASSTGNEVETLRLRLNGLAALHGLTA
jgi:HK97 family phage prohead protease